MTNPTYAERILGLKGKVAIVTGASRGIGAAVVSELTISTIVRLLAYMTTCAALPVTRRKPDLPPAAFLAPAGSLTSVGAIALSAWLVSSSAWSEVRLAAISVIVGAAVFFTCARGSHRASATVLSSRALD